ncbi:biotin synthase BioB [uncultured Clostridium sp.]|uniref:biotin synthase BioB n=1 Tax=uncultured Clostridium sp. TaxID=59620 RepID=UPI0025E4A613|nr:biotin synthase BioB [uncultured Clostridium sp.]
MSLAEDIIKGRRLKRGENLSFLITENLEILTKGADMIRKELCGDKADLCSIINGKSGKCSENCKFCSQSAHHKTSCISSDFIDINTIMKGAKDAAEHNIDRYCIVTAGRAISKQDLEKALKAYRKIHEEFPDMILCASHGFMSLEDLKRLKEAGVSMYHENIETSEENFKNICTTHTFQDKIREIKKIKDAGLDLCCGGIIGMGESWEDRINMALSISELGIRSIPINALIPVKGTPLGNLSPMKKEDILRSIAIFRYINPTADIRIAAGRSYFEDGGKDLFTSGVNAALTGDLLTTGGTNTNKDQKLLKEIGYTLKGDDKFFKNENQTNLKEVLA